eukprot:COSAG01_NODE_1635_length_9663_cov_75.743831_3_plen_73_part_00
MIRTEAAPEIPLQFHPFQWRQWRLLARGRRLHPTLAAGLTGMRVIPNGRIESRWVATPPALAGELRPRRLNT